MVLIVVVLNFWSRTACDVVLRIYPRWWEGDFRCTCSSSGLYLINFIRMFREREHAFKQQMHERIGLLFLLLWSWTFEVERHVMLFCPSILRAGILLASLEYSGILFSTRFDFWLANVWFWNSEFAVTGEFMINKSSSHNSKSNYTSSNRPISEKDLYFHTAPQGYTALETILQGFT